ncbi:MAG: MauE/DoxX family redox-associated membrane protein [Thermodesulfobacteriota bacterium]|nr:MauE/DoxX family redox-associated membrane protein [Thermodesulfobacteriota bacterium]
MTTAENIKNNLTWTATFSRLIIGVPFCYAGVTKLIEPNNFAVVIDGYGLLPEALVFPAAIVLPILEIIAATGLFFNIRICLYTIAVLLVLFIGVLGYGIWLGLDVDCGCFGPNDPEQAYHNLKGALLRDLGYLIPTLYLFWFRWRMDNNA